MQLELFWQDYETTISALYISLMQKDIIVC